MIDFGVYIKLLVYHHGIEDVVLENEYTVEIT